LPQYFHSSLRSDLSILFKHLGHLIEVDRRITGRVALPALDDRVQGFCIACPLG
jgi:hypothetical protein